MAQVRITADALRASLSLPKSALPMRANAATREALAQVRVSRDGYVRQLEARKGRPTFVLHDGPPYANGNAHMGHLLNKTIKDVINRHAMLRGKRVVYIPGETSLAALTKFLRAAARRSPCARARSPT